MYIVTFTTATVVGCAQASWVFLQSVIACSRMIQTLIVELQLCFLHVYDLTVYAVQGSMGFNFAVCEQICKSNTGQNTGQCATSDTMLTRMFHHGAIVTALVAHC